MKLRNNITFSVIIPAEIPLLLLVTLSVIKFSEAKRRTTLDSLALMLEIEAAGLSSFFEVRKAEIAAFTNTEAVKSMDFTAMKPFLEEQLNRLAPTYEKFIVGRENGEFHNTSGGNPYQGLLRTFDDESPNSARRSISQRDYWQVTTAKNDQANPVTYAVEQVDRARIEGIEADWIYASTRWSARLGGTIQRPRNETVDQDLGRRARRSLHGSLSYRWQRFTLGSDVLASSSRRDSRFSDTRMPGYALVNLRAQWQPWSNMTLAAHVENLLDKDYETALGYPAQGRLLTARVKVHW